MIEYPRNRQQTIPESSVKIVGLGGAGSNMLDRIALDGIEGAELLSLNTDVRTLASTVAGQKVQLGRNLTKGLGAGGDPELGEKAILEAEDEVRDSLRDRQIVFLCVGLGGGTGSGAAPVVVRLAREAGAFVVVFATMPFAFEGGRRRMQAEESLNQLAVLSNALVTFDNGRMGELVLPKQGVHEAFSAADRMISDSITAVARLVLRPGLINVGLDELMAALKTTRSRCLFGSGIGRGENRAQSALKAALNSPLLDRGSLLEDATTVLVHICGGEDMTLFEVELLMQGLTKFIPDDAHLLFGAATDTNMKDALSVTIISALPEERLQAAPAQIKAGATNTATKTKVIETVEEPDEKIDKSTDQDDKESEDEIALEKARIEKEAAKLKEKKEPVKESKKKPQAETKAEVAAKAPPKEDQKNEEKERERFEEPKGLEDELEDELEDDEDKLGEKAENAQGGKIEEFKIDEAEDDLDEDEGEAFSVSDPIVNRKTTLPDAKPKSRFGFQSSSKSDPEPKPEPEPEPETSKEAQSPAVSESDLPKKKPGNQGELLLDGAPKGRFDGDKPNTQDDGEDLDIPPYLRRKGRRR